MNESFAGGMQCDNVRSDGSPAIRRFWKACYRHEYPIQHYRA